MLAAAIDLVRSIIDLVSTRRRRTSPSTLLGSSPPVQPGHAASMTGPLVADRGRCMENIDTALAHARANRSSFSLLLATIHLEGGTPEVSASSARAQLDDSASTLYNRALAGLSVHGRGELPSSEYSEHIANWLAKSSRRGDVVGHMGAGLFCLGIPGLVSDAESRRVSQLKADMHMQAMEQAGYRTIAST